MPFKLHIATSRKIGQPNYGSRGASVGLELEVDSSLVKEPRQLHEQIARLFRLTQQSVDQELGISESLQTASDRVCYQARPATPAQVRALHAIAHRQRLDLIAELSTRFGVSRPSDLSLDEACQLIAAIQPGRNGMAADK